MRKKCFEFGLIAIGIMILVIGGHALAAEVSQGKCLQYDVNAKLITIEAYDIQFSKEYPYGQPTGESQVFDVSKAAIGIAPEPGDILRLAWVDKDGTKSALKVMNVSKQDLRKK